MTQVSQGKGRQGEEYGRSPYLLVNWHFLA